jgi:hypothetical protein
VASANERPGRGRALRVALLAGLGAVAGLSTLREGFYDLTDWGPVAVGVFALALGLAVLGVARPRPAPAIALGALVFLWLWSWLSTTWAESADQALEHAGRWALYAAALAALLWLMRRRGDRWIPLAFATGGIVVVGLYVAATMAFGDGQDLFFGGRLRDPLGYVNGQAGYFLLGFWPCVAAAEQTRNRPLCGLGAAGALLLAGLLVLSQARGVLPALVVSAVVVGALVPGRARRVWVLGAVGLALLVIAGPLLDVYRVAAPEGEGADPQTVARAGKLLLVAAGFVGLAWLLVSLALGGALRSVPEHARSRIGRAEQVVAAAAVILVIGAAWAAVEDPRVRISDAYDSFVNLRVEDPGDTRFLSGGGYRYDYWRVAWLSFRDAPVRGLGAGNYEVRYFTERRTIEDIRQPHSIQMQVLSELGAVGALGLLAFLGAVYAGMWRTARRGRHSVFRRTLAVGCGGAFTAWLAHTSVDWLHILPGVTGVALCAAAGLLAPWGGDRRPGRALGTARILTVVVVGVAVLAAADSVGRIAAADRYRVQARDQLDSEPVESLRLANRALALNDESVPARIIQSAAYARLGDYAKARASLLAAAELEPSDPVPWLLQGDMAVRRGRIRAARAAYERAQELNPRDTQLEALIEDPRRALPEE